MDHSKDLATIFLLAMVCVLPPGHLAEPVKASSFFSIEEIARFNTTPDDVVGFDVSDVEGLAFSPNGKQLTAICERREVHVYDVEKRRRTLTRKVANGDFFDVLFGPAGKILITTVHHQYAGGSHVQAWNVASGERLWE